MFTEATNYIEGDDFIKGNINNTFVQISEIHLQEIKDYNYTKQHQSHEIYTGKNIIFDGLFIIISLNKKANDNYKYKFGTNTTFGSSLVHLDNPEFNELFTVYAENTTEAFYILPSNLLERMVDFVHKTGRNFDFSVVDDKFYIAIPYNRPLLEPPIFKSLFDYSIYEEYLTDLELAIGIVEDLKLA